MKTTESKYTLVVADLRWDDTNPQNGNPGRLQNQLTEILPKGAVVGRGMFLFDTHRDYSSISRLLRLLEDSNRLALTLPIESELHLVCDATIEKNISEAFPDLKLFRVKPRTG